MLDLTPIIRFTAKILVGKPFLFPSQVTSITAHAILGFTNLRDFGGFQDFLWPALVGPAQPPPVTPGFLALEPLGVP
jgi:hypothetical protein